MIHPLQTLAALDPVKSPVDPLQQAGKLADLQNTQQAGVLQGQQIAAGQDQATARAQAQQTDAAFKKIFTMPGAIGLDGKISPQAIAAASQIDPQRTGSLLKATGQDPNTQSEIDRRTNENTNSDLQRRTAVDTLSESKRHNQAIESVPKAIDPLSTEGVAAKIATSQGEYHAPIAPRNIDPNSPEGIAAQLKLKAGEAKLKPAAESNIPPLTAITQTTQAGRKYIDASQVEPKSLNELQTAAAQQGVPVVNKDTAGILTEIDTAKQNLDLMMQTLQPKLATGAATRPLVGLHNKISEFLQTDSDLAAVGTYRNAAIQAMRAVAGSKGLRINRSEIELAIENDIPKTTDTVEAAKAKIGKMAGFLENMEKAHLVNDRSNGNAPPAAPAASGGWSVKVKQ
jgi:hypothetical protein